MFRYEIHKFSVTEKYIRFSAKAVGIYFLSDIFEANTQIAVLTAEI